MGAACTGGGATVSDDILQVPKLYPKTCYPLKDAVHSKYGIACSSQTLASQIGQSILERGGSALDACVAMAAALCVTEAPCTGVGGDIFAQVFEASSGKTYGMNASGRSPKDLSYETVLEGLKFKTGLIDDADECLPFSLTYPSALAGWFKLHEKFGVLPMAELLEPAAFLAENGFPVARVCQGMWNSEKDRLMKICGKPSKDYLVEDGGGNYRAPNVGEVFKFPKLAKTLRMLGEEGLDVFYRGKIAEAMVRASADVGGYLTMDDMEHAANSADYVEPVSTEFEGYTVSQLPPNGQGIQNLMALNIIKHMDLTNVQHGSAEYFHALIEAIRMVLNVGFRAGVVNDPDVAPNVDFNPYLTDEWAKEQVKKFNPNKRLDIEAISPILAGDTTYFCAVDAKGNACSMIQSVANHFGSCISVEDYGFMLQDRGVFFHMDEGHPNQYAPRKRPYHTIIAGMVTKDGKIVGPFGNMGGLMQVQAHTMHLVSTLKYGLSPQEALNAPRFRVVNDDSKVRVEPGVGMDVINGLRDRGHIVEIISDRVKRSQNFGRGQMIMKVGESDVFAGGSDMRSDGCACALPFPPKDFTSE